MFYKAKRKVKHKDKNTCRTLASVLEKQHGIPKGSLLKVTGKISLIRIEASVDTDNVLKTTGQESYVNKVIGPDNCVLYLDVVFDPSVKRHFFRFLVGEQILGLPFSKGFTFGEINKKFSLVASGSYSFDSSIKHD